MQRSLGDIKEHYKMYKSGKHWVYAAITVFSLGFGGFTLLDQTTVSADTVDNSTAVTTQNNDKLQNKNDATVSTTRKNINATDVNVDHSDLDSAVNTAKDNGVEVTQDAPKDKTVTKDKVDQARNDVSKDYADQTNKINEANQKQKEKNQQFKQDQADAATTNTSNQNKIDQAVSDATKAGANVTHDTTNDKNTESNITDYEQDKATVNSDTQATVDKINAAKENAKANDKVSASNDTTDLDTAIKHAKEVLGEENVKQGDKQNKGQVTKENADQVASTIKNDYANQVKLIDDQLKQYQDDKAAREAAIDDLVKKGNITQEGDFVTDTEGWFAVTLHYTITYHFDKDKDTYVVTNVVFSPHNHSSVSGGAGFNDAVIAHAPGGIIPKNSDYFDSSQGDVSSLDELQKELSKDEYQVIYGLIQNNKEDETREIRPDKFKPYDVIPNADGSYTLLEFYNRTRGKDNGNGKKSYTQFEIGKAEAPQIKVPVLKTPTINYHYNTYTKADTNVSYSNHTISVAKPEAEKVSYQLTNLHSVPATQHVTTNRTIHYVDKQTGDAVAKDVTQTVSYELTAISDEDNNFLGYDTDGDGIADTQDADEAWVMSGGLAAVDSPDLTAKGYTAPDKATVDAQNITLVNGKLSDTGKDETVYYDHQTINVTPENPGQPGQPIDPQNPSVLYPKGTSKNDVSRIVNETVEYQYEDGSKAAPTHTDQVTFNREITIDKVTGKIVGITDWQAVNGDTSFDQVDSPVIAGYYADKAQIPEFSGLTADSSNINKLVVYKPLGSLVPSSEDPNFPNPGNTVYPNDPDDPTKPGEVTVPEVPGYTPQYPDGTPVTPGTVITPDDPTKDTPIEYVRDKGTVIVNYVDDEENKLTASENISGNTGDKYDSHSKIINGYVLIKTPANASGEIIKGETTVTYVYTPVGSLVPSSEDPNFPNPGNTVYPNDPTDPNKVGTVIVPNVPGYTPYYNGNPVKPGTVLTPEDPTKDINVIYVKDKEDTTVVSKDPGQPETPNQSNGSQVGGSQVVYNNNKPAKVENVTHQSKNELPQTGEKQNESNGVFATILAFVSVVLGMLGINTDKRSKKNF